MFIMVSPQATESASVHMASGLYTMQTHIVKLGQYEKLVLDIESKRHRYFSNSKMIF